MQVEWKWCNRFSRGNLKHKLYTASKLWEEAPLPSCNILCAFLQGLHPNITFPRDSKWEPQNWDSCYSKILDVHIFLKSSILKKCKHNILYLFKNVQHASIGPHLTPSFKGFVVGSQIGNLTFAPSFDHNLCKSCLNEQCESILIIHSSRNF